MRKGSISLAAASLVLAAIAGVPASAQQARMEVGRDFLASNETHKRQAVEAFMRGDPPAVNLCAPGKSADDLAGQLTAWLERNPQAGTQPLSVAFTRMLESTCAR